MNSCTKKLPFFFLLLATHNLYATKSVYQASIQAQKMDCTVRLPRAKEKLLMHGYCGAYSIPTDVFFLITYFIHDNTLKYKNNPLPQDLSKQDLNGFNFTGCQFTSTNLTDTNLEGAILTDTTCNYQKAFLDNIKKNNCYSGAWYQENVPKELKTIASVYPKLKKDAHKAQLLHIACGLSRLPFYKDIELYIKITYWSCALLKLKQKVDNSYSKEIPCLLSVGFKYDIEKYCWVTQYPQDKITINNQPLGANFVQYLEDFNKGITQHKCQSKYIWGFTWYKKNIRKNILGLQRAYVKVEKEIIQAEMHQIGYALSKSYQVQESRFFFHYVDYQNRLIQLKNLVGVITGNNIHYNISPFILSCNKLKSW